MIPSSPRSTPASNAVEAEATGEQHVVVWYAGQEYKIPAAVEDWPIELVAVSVGVRDGRLVADHGTIARALGIILGADQWHAFLREFPRRRNLVPASTAFAEAAGFGNRADDVAFGSIPRLLATLGAWPEAVEATLGELGIDYRDRWRLDELGRRRLTLRQIHVRLSHASPQSPLGIAQNGNKRPHSGTELLLMDLFEALTRTRHPSRPMPAGAIAARASKEDKIEAERKAYRERQAKRSPAGRRGDAIETARANARRGKDANV